LHIAQIGLGCVGRPTAYSILSSNLADTFSVCDIKPGLADAFAEELRHTTASLNIDVEIFACNRDEDVIGADIIIIAAGKPQTPKVKMTRRDLAVHNGKIIRDIAKILAPNNPGAKYIVITNPVDAMAMICKKYSKAKFVISTGTNLESLRLRSQLSKTLKIPVSKIEGWVGGEHGKNAIILWSTIKINGIPLTNYLESTKKILNKKELEFYVKSIPRFIIDNIGGTGYGPAASFRDIVNSIIKNSNEYFPIAVPMKFKQLSIPVFVSVPLKLGKEIGNSIFNKLASQEKEAIVEAAHAIFQTYTIANQ
jgi:malate dehydrogenase